jgi:hypothetical protein
VHRASLRNQYDQTVPAAGAGSFAGKPADPNMLEYDFDDGTNANNIIGGPGLPQNSTDPAGNPTPWNNESKTGPGDSGGPGLIGTIGNGNGPVGGAGNQLQIVGVNSWGTGTQFGALGGQVLANTYNNPPAPGVAAGFIWTGQNNTPYGAILDMRLQVLGFAGQPQDPLTITVRRGTAAGAFQADGPNLLIQVVDTAQAADFQYNSIYFNQPINTPAGAQLLTSLVLRGNDGNDTFDIQGNLGLGANPGHCHRRRGNQHGGVSRPNQYGRYYLPSHGSGRRGPHSSHHQPHCCADRGRHRPDNLGQ